MVKTPSRNASPPSPLLSVGTCSVFAREALRHRPTPAGLPGRGPRGRAPAPRAQWLCGSAAAHCGKASPFRPGFSKLSEATPQNLRRSLKSIN
jgi:hypothetical protein